MTHSLSDILTERARSTPNGLAFTYETESLTYGQLQDDAGAIASGLLQIGLVPGDRVALLMPAGLDWVRVFWAIQRIGAVSCAFNPYVPEETALRRATRVRPRLVLTSLEDIPRGIGSAPQHRADGEAIAFLQPTSGTSGESRAVMIRQRSVLSIIESSHLAYGVSANDVLVSWVPPWHDLGLVRFMIGAVFDGAPCHIVAPAIQTIPLWLETMTRVRATITGAPDFAYRLAARMADPAKIDLSAVRWMVNGGEPVRASTIEMFESRFGSGHIVCPAYGLAEATLGVTFANAGAPPRLDERGNVSCGPALPDVELRIQDDEILMRGPGVFAGYFDAPEATEAVLRDGWLHTGDVGHLDEDGNVYVLGRRRAMIKRGGAVLAPRELEEAAQNIASVRVAAAVGLPRTDDQTEQVVVAIEIDPKADEAAVRTEVAREVQRTIGFAPDQVLVFPPRTIPRTYNGKIRHAALREELQRRSGSDQLISSSTR